MFNEQPTIIRALLYGLIPSMGVGALCLILIAMSMAVRNIPMRPIFMFIFMIVAFFIGIGYFLIEEE